MDTKKDKNTELVKKETSFFNDEHNSPKILDFYANLIFKVGRLAAAVYLVTEHVQEEEILRKKLRVSSIGLLSEIIYGKQQDKISSLVEELMALLTVAKVSGVISEPNSDILYAEYQKMKSLLLQRSPGDTLSKGFFAFPPQSPEPSASRRSSVQQRKLSKGHYKGHSYERSRISKTGIPSGSVQDADFKGHSIRSAIILDLLKKKPFVTVKDISDAVTDCSGKTLQRDLIAMVQEGVLKKEGERRWSRYLLSEIDLPARSEGEISDETGETK